MHIFSQLKMLWRESDRHGRVQALLYLFGLVPLNIVVLLWHGGGASNVILMPLMVLFAWQSLWHGRVRALAEDVRLQFQETRQELDALEAWVDGWMKGRHQ